MILMRNIIKHRLFPLIILPRRSVFKTSNQAAENTNIQENDQPIKYSTSPASRYKAKLSITNDLKARLWYEPYVILSSITVFLIYFTVLREENDIDEELVTPLYKRIDGLEEVQLKNFLEHGAGNTEQIAAAKQRLKEIDEEKIKVLEVNTQSI